VLFWFVVVEEEFFCSNNSHIGQLNKTWKC